MLVKYVVQSPGLGIADLKSKFIEVGVSRKGTILSDVGILAVRHKCKDSINFLIENLRHEYPDVRRVAIDYLSDLSAQHPLIFEACRALREVVVKEECEKSAHKGLHDFAKKALDKIEKRARV